MRESFLPETDDRKRGKARPSSQLSRLQFEILEYLHNTSKKMMQSTEGRQQLEKIGIPWSAKHFCVTTNKEINASTRATISGSLSRLIRRSGLLTASRVGIRTTHVKLTSQATKIIDRGQHLNLSTDLIRSAEEIGFLHYFYRLEEAKILLLWVDMCIYAIEESTNLDLYSEIEITREFVSNRISDPKNHRLILNYAYKTVCSVDRSFKLRKLNHPRQNEIEVMVQQLRTDIKNLKARLS
jgi:hypothetical protein